MRRLFPLVALSMLSWSQVVGLQCPVVEPHYGHDSQSTDLIDAGLHPDGNDATHDAGTPASGGMDCRVAMTCAWAMIDPAAAFPALELAAPLHRCRGSVHTPHTTADLLSDPPPPRLVA